MKIEPDKHTPGPWLIIALDKMTDVIPGTMEAGKNNGKRAICRLMGTDKRANARLIAAAPNMLKALKALDLSFGRAQSEEVNDLVSSAIAKAEGRA